MTWELMDVPARDIIPGDILVLDPGYDEREVVNTYEVGVYHTEKMIIKLAHGGTRTYHAGKTVSIRRLVDSTEGDAMSGRRHDDVKTTADVAVTGRHRPLDLTDREREIGAITDRLVNPPEREAPHIERNY